MKKLINKILHLFGYHLVHNPRPYQRKPKPMTPEEIEKIQDHLEK